MQPLALAAVFSLFFGLLAHIDTGTSVPYPVFAVLGMVTWLFFTSALAKVANSTVTSAPLISKVYFPRLVIPVAAVAGARGRLRDRDGRRAGGDAGSTA